MTTTDSGTETLFSDRCSPCDSCARSADESINSRLAPPNIQPFSGVLEKGKIVIRPIAFKPRTITSSARYGERYGSTPILARPGSRLTLYGSHNELHHTHSLNMNNYSLDRKLRNSCHSTSSSPPLALSSFSTHDGHKLMNYDSLESVRKSPLSNIGCSIVNKPSYCLISASNSGSLNDLTPSPSDSGVSELEAALRDRDSELAYLRQTMEHNEQVIFRVYQEKEKVWERELKRLKTVQESRLTASAQKILKLEQVLMMQTYQLQQEKKRMSAELQKSILQNEILKQEVEHLKTKLEDTEWNLCQKTGEISLLKTQIKESQNEQTYKCQELLQLRTEFREIKELVSEQEEELIGFKNSCSSKDLEIAQLKEEIKNMCTKQEVDSLDSLDKNYEETERLKAEIRELREELSDMSINDYGGIEPGRVKISDRIICETEEEYTKYQENNDEEKIEDLTTRLELQEKKFENERRTWAQEKEKVLRYQRQLQMNYVNLYRRNKILETEIQNVMTKLGKNKTNANPPLDLFQSLKL